MKNTLFLVLTLTLIILSACSNGSITAQPIAEDVIQKPKIDELCKNIICPDNRYCELGKCICNEGKICNNKCIPEDACCTDKDCKTDELCQELKCEKQICPLYQVYDREKKKCVCNYSSKWCSAQNTCIPIKACCRHTECGFDERCVETRFFAIICINDDQKHCKSVIEGRYEKFKVGTEKYEVELIEILEDKRVKYKINGQPIIAVVKGKYDLGMGHKVHIEKIEFTGGHCKLDG